MQEFGTATFIYIDINDGAAQLRKPVDNPSKPSQGHGTIEHTEQKIVRNIEETVPSGNLT